MTFSSPFNRNPDFLKGLNTNLYKSRDGIALTLGQKVYLIEDKDKIVIDEYSVKDILPEDIIEIEKEIPNGLHSRKVKSNTVYAKIGEAVTLMIANYIFTRDVTIKNKLDFLTRYSNTNNLQVSLDFKVGDETTSESI